MHFKRDFAPQIAQTELLLVFCRAFWPVLPAPWPPFGPSCLLPGLPFGCPGPLWAFPLGRPGTLWAVLPIPGTLFWLSCLLPGLFLGSFGCLWCSNRPSKWASERTANCKRTSMRTPERTPSCSCAACPQNDTVDGYRQEQASIYLNLYTFINISTGKPKKNIQKIKKE